jgi:hypothetical protein
MDTRTKPNRLAIGSVIVVTASIVLFYMMSILFGLSLGWILGLLLSSMVATVWMVIRILKDPYTTDKTFDEYFTRIVRTYAAMAKNNSRNTL